MVGTDGEEVRNRASTVMGVSGVSGPVEDWLANVSRDWVVGTVDEAVGRLHELVDAGVQRVMLGHLAYDDLAVIELLGHIAAEVAS